MIKTNQNNSSNNNSTESIVKAWTTLTENNDNYRIDRIFKDRVRKFVNDLVVDPLSVCALLFVEYSVRWRYIVDHVIDTEFDAS